MVKDYYKILNVNKKSSEDEIKKKYKKLALVWHPDRNKSQNAEQKFKEINEAYTTLSDQTKRKEYDNIVKYSGYHMSNFKQNAYTNDSNFFNNIFRDVGGFFGEDNIDKLFNTKNLTRRSKSVTRKTFNKNGEKYIQEKTVIIDENNVRTVTIKEYII